MAETTKTYLLLTQSPAADAGCEDDEFDESDVWGFGPESRPEDRRAGIGVRRKKTTEKTDRSAVKASSLPVNIPDWSKRLKEGDLGRGGRLFEMGEDDEDVMVKGSVIPPHLLVWRRREASFSVQEGIGRTLKGRDLSRVRDAIWRRTGFEA